MLTHPDVAHSLVAFRAHTMDAAEANAKTNGFRGAMYPWEADELGHETTPHFAAQNAHSEIHVNGDVALAQWQYFQASGDSAWLAREGFPVIRETANFWVSRATYDSTLKRYHIRNVVSVAEGLVGVNDDAYTNSVARRNLEIATAASQRLGVRADPRWADVAARLHMPLDSATQSFRTYEGAPDSTLGDITPLLSYPLGVPMSERAKRMHLDQALTHIEDDAAHGAMMGSHPALGKCGGAGRSRARRLTPAVQLSRASEGTVSHAVGDADQRRGEFSHRRGRISAAGDLRLHGTPTRRRRAGAEVPARAADAHQAARAARHAK